MHAPARHVRRRLSAAILVLPLLAACGSRTDAELEKRLLEQAAANDSLRVELELLGSRAADLEARVERLLERLGKGAAPAAEDGGHPVPPGLLDSLYVVRDSLQSADWLYDSRQACSIEGGERVLLSIVRRDDGASWANLAVRYLEAAPGPSGRLPEPHGFVFDVDGRSWSIGPVPGEVRRTRSGRLEIALFQRLAVGELDKLALSIAGARDVRLAIDYGGRVRDRWLSAEELAGMRRMLDARRLLSRAPRTGEPHGIDD